MTTLSTKKPPDQPGRRPDPDEHLALVRITLWLSAAAMVAVIAMALFGTSLAVATIGAIATGATGLTAAVIRHRRPPRTRRPRDPGR